MCGIAGIVECDSPVLPREKNLRQMLGMLRHRGPDQFGVFLDAQVGLGNARLSIIDVDGGQQPIGSEDGNLWIVFNGEVFNYLELRTELEALGHRFATRSDTEVVLHAFEEFGPDCLTRFNGQFAFAIWNRRRKELFLARDRLGVRPLFYTRTSNKLIFASEIKAILTHDEVSAELDLIGITQVFTYWSTISSRTAFHAIQSVPPGHYLFLRDGRVRLAPYWTLKFPFRTDEDTRTLDDCVDEFRALLMDAVKLRLRSDVPVGAYLSGGLDSSTIAAIVKQLGVTRLETFSIAFDDPRFDESAFQKKMADFLGTEHHVVRARHADIGRVFPEVIWHTETPVTRTAPGPMYLLSQLVNNRNYKVVLTGEGADEFLGGYDIFKETMIRQFWRRQPESQWRPQLLRRLYPDIPGLAGTASNYIFAFFGKGLQAPNDPYFSHAIRWSNSRRAERFFSEELKQAMDLKESLADQQPPLPPEYWLWHPLSRAQFLEISLFFSQYLLSSQGDRPAMAHSVEGRFPFLDTRVVEFCNNLPPRLKLSGLREKLLLRRAARDWLPDEIVSRGKRPYRAPVHQSFFNGAPLDYVNELLSREAIRDVGLFNPTAVERLAAKARTGGALGETDDMALVGILSTQLLHHSFIEDFVTREPISDADNVKVIAAFPKGGRFNLKAA